MGWMKEHNTLKNDDFLRIYRIDIWKGFNLINYFILSSFISYFLTFFYSILWKRAAIQFEESWLMCKRKRIKIVGRVEKTNEECEDMSLFSVF